MVPAIALGFCPLNRQQTKQVVKCLCQ